MRHEAELRAILREVERLVEPLDADERRWLGQRIGEAEHDRPLASLPDEATFTPPVGRLRTDEEKRELRRRFYERYAPGQPVPPAPEPATPDELARRGSLSALRGIMNPTGKQYTDEELDRIRYDAIAEKHLRR